MASRSGTTVGSSSSSSEDARLEALRREFEHEASFKQVAAVQDFINHSQAPRRYRLVVERTAVDLIGPDMAPDPAALQVPIRPAPADLPQGGAQRP